jgi:hypothetical protein
MKTTDVLWALGGVAAVGGIGAIVYFATRPKTTESASADGTSATTTGSGTTATPPPDIPPHVFTLSQIGGASSGSLW